MLNNIWQVSAEALSPSLPLYLLVRDQVKRAHIYKRGTIHQWTKKNKLCQVWPCFFLLLSQESNPANLLFIHIQRCETHKRKPSKKGFEIWKNLGTEVDSCIRCGPASSFSSPKKVNASATVCGATSSSSQVEPRWLHIQYFKSTATFKIFRYIIW